MTASQNNVKRANPENHIGDITRRLQRIETVASQLNGSIVFDSITGAPLLKRRDESLITIDMRDPDFALKELEKLNKGRLKITCSKCHHCR